MEQRRLVIAMVLAMALALLWQPVFKWIGTQLGYNMEPLPPAITSTTQPATNASPTTVADGTPVAPGTVPSMSAAVAGLRVAPSTQPNTPVELGSTAVSDPTYHMAVRVRPEGAGLDSVVLNEFKQSSKNPDPYTFQQPYPKIEASRALATRSITVNGNKIDLTTIQWELESSSPDQAVYGVTLLGSNGSPQVRVHKTYRVLPKSDPSGGYEMVFSQTFDNLTSDPMKLATTFNGPTTPPMESDRGGDRQTLIGFANKGFINVTHDLIESFTDKAPTRDYTKDKEGNKSTWAGTSSIYFNALVHPIPLADPNQPAEYIDKITASVLEPKDDHHIAMTFDTTEQTIAPGQSLSLPMRVFFGPRQRSLLNGDYFSKFPLAYDQTLVLTSGPCGFCTFQWLINFLVWMLGVFHAVLFKDWGLAIIALVVLVRALLHPITKRSQISMSKMSKMGPEMERLKKKYEGQPDELNKAMMQFYKTQGATPILGCLPMFLQMPIWIALWQSLQTTFELRQAPFLNFFGHSFTWIHDLSKPDHLIELSQPVHLIFSFSISGLNILPLLLAVVFFIQQKMQPQPAAMSPEQEQQQKMMKWMTVLLFPLMFYNGPSGLNLYILTSTFIGIIESKIVRDHIKQRDEAEKEGKVIVDPGAKMRRGGESAGAAIAKRKPDGGKPGGLMKWLSELQQKAEDMKRETERRKKDQG